METRILFIFIVALYSRLVEGSYGEKGNTDETENNISTEEFSEETVTVPDDGVTIEKAILAAEITPKASYNLVDPPKQSKESQNELYTESITAEDHQQGYPDSEQPMSAEFGSRLKPSSSGGSSSSAGSDRVKLSSTYSDGKQNSHYDLSSATDTEWDYPSSSGDNYLENNHMTSSTSHSDGEQSSYQDSSSLSHSRWNNFGYRKNPQQLAPTSYQSNNFEIVQANVNEINNDNYSPYDYVKKLNSKHKTRSSWTPYQTPDNIAQLAKENEAKLRLEQERLHQIEAAKSYLNQIQTAQDYAAKVNQQNQYSQWRPITSNNQGTYLPPKKSTVVPKNQAPGVSNFGSENQTTLPRTYLPQTHYQSSHNTFNNWRHSSSLPGRPQGYAFYSGPTAVPVILPSGFIADTEEVVQARIAHLKAIMEAIKAASLWKDARALKQWQY